MQQGVTDETNRFVAGTRPVVAPLQSPSFLQSTWERAIKPPCTHPGVTTPGANYLNIAAHSCSRAYYYSFVVIS